MVLTSVPLLEDKNITYSHGGYYGFCDGVASLLKSELAGPGGPLALLHELEPLPKEGRWADARAVENSPVMTAMGHVGEHMTRYHNTFFRDDLYQACSLPKPSNDINSVASDDIPEPRPVEWDIFIHPHFDHGGPDVTEKIAISHGSPKVLVMEALGWSGYASVRPISPTPRQWLLKYIKCLLVSVDPTKVQGPQGAAITQFIDRFVVQPSVVLEQKDIFDFFQQAWPALFGKLPKSCFLRLVIDVKSRKTTPKLLRLLMTVLNNFCVVIWGVGSFDFRQIEGVNECEQHVFTTKVPSPLELRFVHTVGDIIGSTASLEPNRYYLFNVGSLMTKAGARIIAKPHILERLEAIVKEKQINLGVYMQESAIHPTVLAAVVDMCNKNRHIFPFGCCLSGVNGVALSPDPSVDVKAPLGPNQKVDTGLGLQRFIGRSDRGGKFWSCCRRRLPRLEIHEPSGGVSIKPQHSQNASQSRPPPNLRGPCLNNLQGPYDIVTESYV